MSMSVVYSLPTQSSDLALTIDDGPDPVGTPAILDVLARHQAHATFFVIGSRVAGREHLLERMRRECHELGNHTSYDRPSIWMQPRALEVELRQTHALLSSYGPVRWFRPGSGFFTPRMVRSASAHGYRTALGNVYPLDHLVASSRFCARFIRRWARAGSIVILHDGPGRGLRTAECLNTVLPALLDRGYRVVTLSTLAEGAGGANDSWRH